MLYILATGQRVDQDKLERFGTQVDEVYQNPFKKTAKLKTAADIKDHILGLIRKTKKRLEGKHGPDDPGSENNAG